MVQNIFAVREYITTVFCVCSVSHIAFKMALEEDPQNFLLMHSIGVNVSGQIASVIAGGLILSFFMA